MVARLSRRTFLGGLAAVGISGGVLGGCRAASSGRVAPSDVDGPVFTLGVASGDPRGDGIVLWTRLAPDPLDPAGAGMPGDADADVAWEVATDDRFATVVASGTARAPAAAGHSVHVSVDGLERGVDHHYRFGFGDETSATGRFRLSSLAPGRARVVVATCQGIEWGHHAAWRDAAGIDPDLIIFLGDYIYEYPPDTVIGSSAAATPHVGGEARDLPSYRQRYAQYHLSPGLQAAHAAAAWALTWDDHEVTNNYTGAAHGDVDPVAWEQRRFDAARALWENAPMRGPAPTGADTPRYGTVDMGDLVRLHVLETRQFASPVPCRGSGAGDRGPLCDGADNDDHTMLGNEQQAWLDASLESSHARWDLVASPTQVAGSATHPISPTNEPWVYRDAWDGYPQSRRRLVDSLGAVDNPFVVSGDYHCGIVANVHPDPWAPRDGERTVPEFTTPAISSSPFDVDLDRNPHVAWKDTTNGHVVLEVDTDAVEATFRTVDDVADAGSTARIASRWRMAPGRNHLERLA
jgi:alkaline phosphatase D